MNMMGMRVDGSKPTGGTLSVTTVKYTPEFEKMIGLDALPQDVVEELYNSPEAQEVNKKLKELFDKFGVGQGVFQADSGADTTQSPMTPPEPTPEPVPEDTTLGKDIGSREMLLRRKGRIFD